jgi:putative DNA primase/helicase
MSNTLDQFVKEHFKNPVKAGKGFNVTCPAHDDKKQSLSINLEGDRFLLHCQTGTCSIENVLEAAGLKKTDLFLKEKSRQTTSAKRSSSQVVKVYDYNDQAGNLVFQVCRTEPKGFFQRQPNGKPGLAGVTPILYNLPDVVSAVKESKPVYIVEGEKAADELQLLGLTATTCPMGAGKWRPEYSECLSGGIVFILPDNDKAGKLHAEQVADALIGSAAAVHVIEGILPDLPEKADVYDWLQAGNTVDQLQQLAISAPEWEAGRKLNGPKPNLMQMSTIAAEQVKWLWQDLIPSRKLTLMEGNPGDGKTWAALQIAADVSAGGVLPNPETGIPDLKVGPANVLYMSAEDGPADTLRPRLDAAKANCENVYLFDGGKDRDGKLVGVTLSDVEMIEAALRQTRPALLIIDPIQGFLGSGVDMFRANETRPLLAALGKLAEKYNTAVLCIRHLTKANSTKAIYRGMGSIDFSAAARSILLVGRDPDDPDKRVIIQTKNSLAPMAKAIGFEIRENSFYWTGSSELTTARVFREESDDETRNALDEAKEFLLEALKDGPVKKDEITKEAKGLGITDITMRRAKQALNIKAKKLKSKHAPWTWELPEKE